MIGEGPVLVVAAHPDDEVLGCGGTIARMAAQGIDVYLFIVGEGITSRYANRDDTSPDQLSALQTQCESAATILGVKEVFFGGLPDNRLDTLPLLSIVKLIEKLIEELGPRTVFTHYSGDLNVDHSVLHRAVLTATRPSAGSPVADVYCFEIPSSTDWAFDSFDGGFRPNFFVDIGETREAKLRAMACYESETAEFPHPRSARALDAAAERWGSVVGRSSAEPFMVTRIIR